MIDNAHYSGVYGLMKLILPEALPVSLSQVTLADVCYTVIMLLTGDSS